MEMPAFVTAGDCGIKWILHTSGEMSAFAFGTRLCFFLRCVYGVLEVYDTAAEHFEQVINLERQYRQQVLPLVSMYTRSQKPG